MGSSQLLMDKETLVGVQRVLDGLLDRLGCLAAGQAHPIWGVPQGHIILL